MKPATKLLYSVASILFSTCFTSCSNDKQKEITTGSISRREAASSTSGVGGGRNFLFNNEGIFPVGFYAEGFNGEEGNTYAATTLANAGFDFLFTEHDVMNNEEFTRFFDKCDEIGMKNIIGYYTDIKTDFTNNFKSKPSLFMWGIADDGDQSFRIPIVGTPELIQARTTQMKELDPNHLPMGAITTAPYAPGEDSRLENLFKAIDVQAVQWYPITTEGARDIRGTYDLMYRSDMIAQKINKPSVAILQTQKVPPPIGSTSATTNNIWINPTEVKFLAYTSIAAGVKGVIFYTFKDYDLNGTKTYIPGTTIDISHPDVFNAAKDFNSNFKTYLQEAVMNGQYERLSNFGGITTPENTSDYSIVASNWNYNNSTYFIITNQNNSVAENVSVRIPDNTRVVMRSLIPSMPQTLQLQNGRITGTLQPLEVQVLILQSEQTSLGGKFSTKK